jgi:UDP-N-acetylmuramoyl-tripeptide--D-alanyl-D-alanine ligase
MISLSLSEIAHVTGGSLYGEDKSIKQLNTDSRTLTSEEVFLALKGPSFDGHRFVEQAQALNCHAVIVDHLQDITIAQIVVEDTRIALGQIGAYVKEKSNVLTVGITGSSGKTTVKEMTAAILSRLGRVLATAGNFNNDIGVPLTLLRLDDNYDYAVIEMGANHLGEIAYTCNLVKPDVALINNIAPAHLEGFGDLMGVARAKAEIYEGLKANGSAIYNSECKFADTWQWRLADKKVRTFSVETTTGCYSSHVVLNDDGCASFQLNTSQGNCLIELTLPGKHNVCNALAAATIALEMGASLNDISLGLAAMAPVKGRLNLYQLDQQYKVIDDTYNANVGSIKAASELLANFSGCRILLLGDMGELGEKTISYHQEVGVYAKKLGIDNLLTLGELSQYTCKAFGDDAYHFSDKALLIQKLQTLLIDEHRQVSILVKGSRSSKMELVVQDIVALHESNKTLASIDAVLKNNNGESC